MSTAVRIAPNAPLAGALRPLAHEGVTLRILMVIDGRIGLHHDESGFGLGFVIDTLCAMWFGPARIDLGLATRNEAIDDYGRGGFDVLYTGFRFDQPGFRIDDWDQVWIFADEPSRSDDFDNADSLIVPENRLGDEEARLLAEWMDRGGGIFATGDHNNLGAAVCHRIPRVRTMRRWRMADGVPRMDGNNRNTTLQPSADPDQEGDLVLQPLELVHTQSVGSWPFLLVDRPHPVLCSSAGPIDRFPDHMHEGEIVPNAEVQLDRPLDIPGYTRPEYPRAIPEVLARMIGAAPTINWRPRPAIIAYGHTTNLVHFEPPEELAAAFIIRPDSAHKRFGVVGVYDGEAANIGRIVCDSTWHHWFSLNLHGIAVEDGPAYRMMQSYYRNIALWLAKLPQRQRLLTAAVWNVLTQSSPMEFTGRQTQWEMGERVTAALSRFIGPCWVNELVASQFSAAGLYRISQPRYPDGQPEWSRLPEGLVNRAVIGSLAKALYPLASQLRLDLMRKGDVQADSETIEELAKAGLAQVPGLLRETLTTAIASMTGLRDSLEKR